MIDEEALRQLRERSRDEVRPEDAGAVDGASEDKVAETPRADDVADGGRVHDDGEGRPLVGPVDRLVPARRDDRANRVERREGAMSL